MENTILVSHGALGSKQRPFSRVRILHNEARSSLLETICSAGANATSETSRGPVCYVSLATPYKVTTLARCRTRGEHLWILLQGPCR